jgi:hypothetical protein
LSVALIGVLIRAWIGWVKVEFGGIAVTSVFVAVVIFVGYTVWKAMPE